MQINLYNEIHKAKYSEIENTYNSLNDEQIKSFIAFVGSKCRQKTKEKLERRLKTPFSLWTNYGIFSRVILENDNQIYYICGQSWNDEMRTLRECILN